MFNGWIDNAAELAGTLDADPGDAPAIYLAAVGRWGDEADRRVIGSYCSAIAERGGAVRLARSPWNAPPLCYAHDQGMAVAASVPRALFAAGVEARLDERKVADNLFLNLADEEAGWYLGTRRVAQGSVVRIAPDGVSRHRWYDPTACAPVRFARDEDYLEAAESLLGEATRLALQGAAKPGIALSGGLDSSLVASEALGQLPATARLKSFTFRPDEDWDGLLTPDLMGDEGPWVEAFAAMHPRLDPHFTRNTGIEFDHRWPEMFLATGVAPNFLGALYVYHGVWRAAQETGCDVLLDATLGNQTLSQDGRWSYVEHLRTGRWRQLYRTLKHRRGDPRPLWRKLASLSLLPLLPPAIRGALLRTVHPGRAPANLLASAIRPEAAARLDLRARAERAGVFFDHAYPRDRNTAIRLDYLYADLELAEITQGFEQLYGLRQRDVTAYRPLIEFCVGLPTGQLVRDGEERWLAKRLARGRMPEAQRLNPRYGRHDVDWHVRLGRRRDALIEEVRRVAKHPTLGALIDSDRLVAVLEDWPEQSVFAPEEWMPRAAALPRALLTARFVQYVSGRNET